MHHLLEFILRFITSGNAPEGDVVLSFRQHLRLRLSEAHGLATAGLEIAEEEGGRPGFEIFEQAIRNATPMIEVRSRRVGGANYQVPTEVRPSRRLALAMRWIVTGARQRTGRGMAQKLSSELLEASRGQGAAVRRKEEVFRMAEANRAFAHYRW